MVILDSGGNYLYVKEVAGSFTKIGAPLSIILDITMIGNSFKFLVVIENNELNNALHPSIFRLISAHRATQKRA